ncbi:MAG: penicillin-binding protein 2 [Lentisphaerae bacterium GWF2_44_16]|nr:MAG: penicillin-binding protein 2 [Lentisphaerae bacterium GWF2_44_16]
MNFSIQSFSLRILLTGLLFISIYVFVVFKLWTEQIQSGEQHREKISKQSIRKIRLPAVRGRIFSSDMKILADSKPSYNIVFHPAEMRQPGKQARTVKHILEAAKKVAAALGRECPLTQTDILKHINLRPSLPIDVYEDLSPAEIATASEMAPPLQGMEIVAAPKRFYPENSLAAHLIGYTGKSDPQKAEDREDYFYYIPDLIGKSGIEKRYDSIVPEVPELQEGIRGSPGSSLVRVDHIGFIHEIIDFTPATAGFDIVLTINMKAQKIAEKLLEGKRAAFVLLDASNGAVLAMASSPSFNLNSFVPRISLALWRELQKNPDRPMINKATLGAYAPGSIIKPIIALAALENGISPNDEVNCSGAASIGNTKIRCWAWERGGHGNMSMLSGIEQSCNCYFIGIGRKIGLSAIARTMVSAGIGQPTGLPLPESHGLLPSRGYKMKAFKEKWTEFDTSLLSIGQGSILLTPLQVALYTAAIANGGTIWKPYLLSEAKDPSGKVLFTMQPEMVRKLSASPENINIVRKGMWMVVNSQTGSAKTARNDAITLSGKTGTAEMGPKDARYNNTWFIAFGEHKGKLYAIAVLVEKGVSGGRSCAPIVREFFNEWLKESSSDDQSKAPEKKE